MIRHAPARFLARRDLAAKAAGMEARFDTHLHHGLNARVPLRAFADEASAAPQPDDNHGLWTAWRLAAAALRYASDGGSAAAAAAVQQTLAALVRLNAVTGVAGLPARSLAAPTDARTATRSPCKTSRRSQSWARRARNHS